MKNVELDPKDRISLKVIDIIDVLLYNNKRLVIPTLLQTNIVTWYHHYLQHPGRTMLENTITTAMHWGSLQTDGRRYVKSVNVPKWAREESKNMAFFWPK